MILFIAFNRINTPRSYNNIVLGWCASVLTKFGRIGCSIKAANLLRFSPYMLPAVFYYHFILLCFSLLSTILSRSNSVLCHKDEFVYLSNQIR